MIKRPVGCGITSRVQGGVALITALLVVALATLAAVAMATRQQLDIRRTGNLLHSEQAYAYVLGAESWARVVLARDLRDSQTDSLSEDWATQLPASLVEGGAVVGRVLDEQALFNLNSVVVAGEANAAAIERYKRLLDVLDLEQALADPLVDWIDADIEVRFPDGAEDTTYLLMQPAYRTSNQPLADVSELRLIKGYEPEVIEALRPYVTVLPEPATINVNTAGAVVLRTVADQVTDSDAEKLLAARPEEGFASVDEFLALPELAGRESPPDPASLSVQSNWFLLEAQADIGQGRARLAALVHRSSEGTEVIQRRREFVPRQEAEPEQE